MNAGCLIDGNKTGVTIVNEEVTAESASCQIIHTAGAISHITCQSSSLADLIHHPSQANLTQNDNSDTSHL